MAHLQNTKKFKKPIENIQQTQQEVNSESDSDYNNDISEIHSVFSQEDIDEFVDTEKWLFKQSDNKFNFLNLYKARYGQFRTQKEKLSNIQVLKNVYKALFYCEYNEFAFSKNANISKLQNNFTPQRNKQQHFLQKEFDQQQQEIEKQKLKEKFDIQKLSSLLKKYFTKKEIQDFMEIDSVDYTQSLNQIIQQIKGSSIIKDIKHNKEPKNINLMMKNQGRNLVSINNMKTIMMNQKDKKYIDSPRSFQEKNRLKFLKPTQLPQNYNKPTLSTELDGDSKKKILSVQIQQNTRQNPEQNISKDKNKYNSKQNYESQQNEKRKNFEIQSTVSKNSSVETLQKQVNDADIQDTVNVQCQENYKIVKSEQESLISENEQINNNNHDLLNYENKNTNKNYLIKQKKKYNKKDKINVLENKKKDLKIIKSKQLPNKNNNNNPISYQNHNQQFLQRDKKKKNDSYNVENISMTKEKQQNDFKMNQIDKIQNEQARTTVQIPDKLSYQKITEKPQKNSFLIKKKCKNNSLHNLKIVIDPFCLRQFDKQKTTSQFIECSVQECLDYVNNIYDPSKLADGYAPFCKHIFTPNFTETKNQTVEITPENEHLLKTKYEARTEKELPVLRRYFNASDVTLKKAEYLDFILYSKEQIQKETEAMGNEDPNKDIDYDYGVVSIKPQDLDHEIPMDPITMMRNALGKDQGGSGVPLEFEKYMESVKFWEKHAPAK
ncbi:hypothetical protein PPERSA_13045 [Pseudocohnilembus persalinus]|uniref:Uncharacterized protein n=1 Tax=Pseudocohnilembus persalinus TaxID=266149 RepID=A0A0V0R201_PSEPJ|nr:hypothetical protein PPERSA_13045 [Pseudocohnilembus persalinus]|eukprot:KRX08564.1 hypothetical protein PPERSA_13045 [Pseudocohnilembus persalinus]